MCSDNFNELFIPSHQSKTESFELKVSSSY